MKTVVYNISSCDWGSGNIISLLLQIGSHIVGSSNWILIYLELEMQTLLILILLGKTEEYLGWRGFKVCLLLGLAYLYSKSGEVTNR